MESNWAVGFTLDIPEDTFWRWASEDLVPSVQKREFVQFGSNTPGMADLYMGPCDDASLWGIETYELSPQRTKVVVWFDQRVPRWDLSLWPLMLALDVIFTYYPEAPHNLDWQYDYPDSEAGDIFNAALHRLKRGEAGTLPAQQAETARGDGPVADDKESEIAQRRRNVLDLWQQRTLGTTKEKFKRDTANFLAVSESTIRDDLRFWTTEGKIE